MPPSHSLVSVWGCEGGGATLRPSATHNPLCEIQLPCCLLQVRILLAVVERAPELARIPADLRIRAGGAFGVPASGDV